jgi:DNA-binding transcriptional ArsR family regulator
MDTVWTVGALAALAHEKRFAAYRLLVEAGPEGRAAGAIAEALAIPAATLSFHLAQLAQAGLVRARQDGRFIFYSANFEAMNALVGSLTENCCGGNPCGSAVRPAVVRRARQKARS